MPEAPHIRLLVRPPRTASGRSPVDGSGDLWRRVLPRVAEDRLGLELSLIGCQDRECLLPDALAVEDDAVLLALEAEGQQAGLAIVDTAARAALIEVQTTGKVGSGRIDPRPPTAVDAALLRHILDDWLAAFGDARGQPVPPFAGRAFPDPRSAMLALEEGAYRETRLEIDFGGGKRTGVVRLLLAVPGAATSRSKDATLQAVLTPVESSMEAVLGRVRLPLGLMLDLAPGDVLPLDGLSVRHIRLEAPLGRVIAAAHLGQSGGFRAVRILPPGEEKARPAPAKPDRPPVEPPDMVALPEAPSAPPLPDLPDLPPLPELPALPE